MADLRLHGSERAPLLTGGTGLAEHRTQGGEQSDRQWRDVLGVLRVQSNTLDRVYLEDWAKRLGLSDLLTRATKDTEHL